MFQVLVYVVTVIVERWAKVGVRGEVVIIPNYKESLLMIQNNGFTHNLVQCQFQSVNYRVFFINCPKESLLMIQNNGFTHNLVQCQFQSVNYRVFFINCPKESLLMIQNNGFTHTLVQCQCWSVSWDTHNNLVLFD